MFGASIGAMGLLIPIITVNVVLTITLIRSQKQTSKLIITAEHPICTTGQQNSEATCVQLQSEQSSAAIDTERNVMYISSVDAR